jgi:hypothetical protein
MAINQIHPHTHAVANIACYRSDPLQPAGTVGTQPQCCKHTRERDGRARPRARRTPTQRKKWTHLSEEARQRRRFEPPRGNPDRDLSFSSRPPLPAAPRRRLRPPRPCAPLERRVLYYVPNQHETRKEIELGTKTVSCDLIGPLLVGPPARCREEASGKKFVRERRTTYRPIQI